MYFYLYKLTDTKNGKYYLGVHRTLNLDDGYMGSGSRLNKTIKSRCTKQILEFFETEDAMFLREHEVVNQDVVDDDNSYNMMLGGSGGDTLSNHPKLDEIRLKIKTAYSSKSDLEKAELARLRIRIGHENGMYGVHRYGASAPRFGKKHSDHTKELIRKNAVDRCSDINYVNPNKGNPPSQSCIDAVRNANSKQYVFCKDGELVTVTNLSEFCRINELNEACMRHVDAGRNKQHKGYRKVQS